MKFILRLLLLLFLTLVPVWCATSTLTGTFVDASGNPVNGYLILQLPVPAVDTATGNSITVTPVRYRVVNGIVQAGPPVYDVAGLQPASLYYITSLYDNSGTRIFTANYFITGTPFNLSAAIPTNVTTSNISFAAGNIVNLAGINTFTGTNTFTGGLNAQGTFNSVAMVSPSGPVSIQSAVNSVGANGVVWLAPGAYILGSTLTMSNAGASLRCMGSTSVFDSICRITQNNATNLAPMISMTGAQTSMTDIVVDGNGINNPTGTDNIFVNAANITLEHVSSSNAQRHNVNCFQSSTAFFSRLYAQNSITGDNVLMNQCGDSRIINGSSLQNAGQYGLELLNTPTLRMDGTTEVAGSTLDDVYVHGTFPCPTGPGAGCSNNNHLEFSQLANAKNNEFRLVCYDTVGGGYTAWGNMITFQGFGSGFLAANNTYSQIVLQDCDTNQIKFSMLDTKTAPNQQKYAISATETAGGRSLGNNCIIGNMTHTLGSYGTGFINDATTNGAFGCQFPISGGATSSLDLFDPHSTDTTPHKYLTNSGGVFKIVNTAFSGNIFQVDDSGNLYFPGVVHNNNSTGTMGITLKKGSGAGNYTTASTTYVVADSTNLCFTVTIPTGWKLEINASGAIGTATAAVLANIALTDNAACATANAGVLVETVETTTAAGVLQPWALNWAIAGDGNSHNVALQYKTSNAADSATLLNSSATALSTMVFTLMPSN